MRLPAFERGRGERVVVLLHGFLGQGRNLATLARRWSEAAPALRIVVPDLAGHGSAPPPAPGAGLPELAADVMETAEAAGAREVAIVGHSFGGRVALAALDRWPERVRRVTLLDIAPGAIARGVGGSEEVVEILAEAPAEVQDREEMRAWLAARGLSAPIAAWLMTNLVDAGKAFVWRFDRNALRLLHPHIRRADQWGVVERHADRIAAIRGGTSPYVTDADVARFATLGIAVRTIEGAGHFVHIDAPDALLAHLGEISG